MSTAFVLSGGGSLGAIQVGMLQALAERHVTPDLQVGTSAGGAVQRPGHKGPASDSFGAKWWMLNGSGQPITAASPAPTTSGSSSTPPGGGGGYGY